jgi:hypothetical protein
MPRVNVEDELFRDQRFIDLMIALGDSDKALGALVRCWIVAQKFWKHSDNGVPKVEWAKQRLRQEIIDVGLAEDRGDFVFVVGSHVHFAWLRSKVESGIRSGEVRAKKAEAKRASRETITENRERSRTMVERTRTSSSPSLSSSFSLSSSSSDSNTQEDEDKNLSGARPKKPADPGEPFRKATWEAYSSAYWARYQAKPLRDARVNAQIKSFCSRVPQEDAAAIARFYVEHGDFFYVKNRHPVDLLLRDASKLYTEWQTGVRSTRQEAMGSEQSQGYRSQLERIARGEL